MSQLEPGSGASAKKERLDVTGNKYIEETFKEIEWWVNMVPWLGIDGSRLWYSVLTWSLSTLAAGYIFISGFFNKEEQLPFTNIFLGTLQSVNIFIPFTLNRSNAFASIIKGSCFSFNYGSLCMKYIQYELRNKKIKNLKNLFKLLILQTFCANLNVGVSITIDALVNGHRMELYYILLPSFIDPNAPLTQIATFIYQEIVANFTALVLSTFASVIFIFYNHMISELRLVMQGIRLLTPRAIEISEKEEIPLQKAYKSALNLSVEHHQCILNYFYGCLPAVENTFTLAYAIGSVLLISVGFTLTMGRLMVQLEFLVGSFFVLVFLYIMTWLAQDIVNKGDELREAVYEVDWLSLPKDCISTFRILQTATHRPLSINLLSGGAVNMATYLDVVNASYSYYNMIYVTTSGNDK